MIIQKRKTLFYVGISFISILFLSSLMHDFMFDGHISTTDLIYENGKLISDAPHSPMVIPPLGTDMVGNDLLLKLIKGAKYTIGVTVLIAILRIVISLLLSFFVINVNKKSLSFVTNISESLQYVPIALFIFIILSPVLIEGSLGSFQYSLLERIIFQIIILTIITVPSLTLLLANEIKTLMQHEYINAVKIMGGGRWHIYKKHLFPHLKPKLWIHLVQQVIQILVLLIHLGYLHILFGGSLVSQQEDSVLYISVTSEWSGMIGDSFQWLTVSPWIPLAPLLMFTLTLLAMNFILEHLKQNSTENLGIKQIKSLNKPINQSIGAPTISSFKPILNHVEDKTTTYMNKTQ